MGLKDTTVLSQVQELPAGLPWGTGSGSRLLAAVRAWLCNGTQPLQEPFAKAAATATAWLPNPHFLWGLEL